jgi:hypothetical protein
MAEPAPDPDPAPIPFIDQDLENDGFWPAVPVANFVNGYRVSLDYREELIRQVLIAAMLASNKALRPAAEAAKAAGAADLATYCEDNPDATIGGDPLAQVLYLQAVYAHAKGATIKPLTNLQRRTTGEETAANAADAHEAHWQDAHQAAISGLLDIFIPTQIHGTSHGVYAALI